MKRNNNSKKGIALILVAIIVVFAIPVTMVMMNLSSNQKTSVIHYNSRLNLEQVSLSGINYGFSKLKGNVRVENLDTYTQEVSGNDRFDLSISKTGTGFFNQDIYMILSQTNKDDNNSIILADAEQFQPAEDDDSVLVITHDYWDTNENQNISVYEDILNLKNYRGKDQLRLLDVKEFEMRKGADEYSQIISSLKASIPKELDSIWDNVASNFVKEKVAKDDDSGSSKDDDDDD